MSIDKVFEVYSSVSQTNLNQAAAEIIVGKLAPYFRAVPGIKAKATETEQFFVRLTNEQIGLLDYLDEQKSAAIHGAAGSGKTMLAIEKAKRLAEDEKVLFLCFNRFLIDFLRNNYSHKNIRFENLQSLTCSKLKVGDATEQHIYTLLNNYDRYEWDFKHIIIDEGQDFGDIEIDLLSNIAQLQDGCFYVFYDKNQFVQKKVFPDWLNNAECRLVLNKICRNTLQIASTSSKPIQFKPKFPDRIAQGEMPVFHIMQNIDIAKIAIKELIDKYRKNGFAHNQICILTLMTEDESMLAGVRKIGNHSITNVRNEKEILFTTARKFKGLESDVVIMVDVVPNIFESEELRRLYYVGASRAKHYLDLIFVGQAYDLERLSMAIEPESNSKNHLRTIALSLNVKPEISP